MTLSRIPAAIFAALTTATAVQAHDLGDGGAHQHFAEHQGLTALFTNHSWLVLAVAASLIVTGLVLKNWKRSQV